MPIYFAVDKYGNVIEEYRTRNRTAAKRKLRGLIRGKYMQIMTPKEYLKLPRRLRR
jgi:hypothetical protein